MAEHKFSDAALSIFTFAAYHALVSGDPVSEVVLDDGHGHKASPEGISELQDAGLLEMDGDRGAFNSEGEAVLADMIAHIRAFKN
ncbi:hypothetical protein GCM10007989_15640 [Devosia pacifica]|uniref:Uncharacterized protein n=1 Tax=Devosia pacifica TaxID=1335967 RepID=A0A918S2Y6_9HYPH|nr:hypothetical protein [Devosia pacifica]GHA21259.1 hypothetical protein GCM10007989_15640 [Devosia pacifica]